MLFSNDWLWTFHRCHYRPDLHNVTMRCCGRLGNENGRYWVSAYLPLGCFCIYTFIIRATLFVGHIHKMCVAELHSQEWFHPLG